MLGECALLDFVVRASFFLLLGNFWRSVFLGRGRGEVGAGEDGEERCEGGEGLEGFGV